MGSIEVKNNNLQKDVLEAKLTPLHILHSVLAGEGCAQSYTMEN